VNFHHLIELVRRPLLGDLPDPLSVVVSASLFLILALGGYGLFCVFRRRISYWL